MKGVRVVLALVIALSVAAVAAAQEKPKEGSEAGRLSSTSRAFLRFERLRAAIGGLDLTAEQKEKLAKVREEAAPKMKEIRDKLAETLTEDQRQAGREAMQQARDAGKRGREFLQFLEAAIKLTPEQKKEMAKVNPEIVALYKEQVAKVMEILTPEQQAKVKEKLQPRGKKGKHSEKKAA